MLRVRDGQLWVDDVSRSTVWADDDGPDWSRVTTSSFRDLGRIKEVQGHIGGLVTMEDGCGIDPFRNPATLTQWMYDPRFLTFEFLLGFMLRRRQFELVTEFFSRAMEGHSSVNQMIMGQGKTTVIAPLLALMLADGRRLVMQVCPAPLLEMSRSVLRTVFSNVIHKRIYTFKFERSNASLNSLEGVRAIFVRLHRAREEKAVVCSTPESIKSFMLKYNDNLQMVEGAPSKMLRPRNMLKSKGQKLVQSAEELALKDVMADEMAKVIKLWRAGEMGTGGVALLDEVDLLLHPLKSELNFPIGRKEPLDGSPERWNFAVHLLDAIFEISWNGASASPQVTLTDPINTLLKMIGEAFRDGATAEHRHAMTDQPHYVLLRKDYYTRSLGYGSESTADGEGDKNRPSLIQLMAGWSVEWYKVQDSFKKDIASFFETLTSSEGEVASSRADNLATPEPFRAYMPALKRLSELEAEEKDREGGLGAPADAVYQERVRVKMESDPRLWAAIRGTALTAGDRTRRRSAKQTVGEFLNASRRAVQDEYVEEVWRWIKVYITDHTSTPERASEQLKASEPVMEAVFRSANSMRLINLGKDWLCNFLPHAISKINRVSYGLIHKGDIERWVATEAEAQQSSGSASVTATDLNIGPSRELLAVPFTGKDTPSRNSEFAHPEVLIGLTVLAYRYEGLRRSDLLTIFKDLKEKFAAEKGPHAERPKQILFRRWILASRSALLKQRETLNEAKGRKFEEIQRGIEACNELYNSGSDDCIHLDRIHLDEDSQVERLHDALGKSAPVIVHYLHETVFPKVMQHQNYKLAASGVDLGSDMLFGTRLGFSGTPSNLLPLELRPCHFEPGSEAQIVRVATDPNVMCIKEIPGRWSVGRLLDEVRNPDAAYNALIDTGALITGLDNEEVCRAVLRPPCPPHLDVAVFLNSRDEKMYIDREGVINPLSRCGVALKRRFTFYDQVHTTGMDIKQALDARAVCTLGKDMTLRDHAQGVYRMRGLGKGQTITVIVVDEVKELIHESVPPSRSSGLRWKCVGTSRPTDGKQLVDGHEKISRALRRKLAVSEAMTVDGGTQKAPTAGFEATSKKQDSVIEFDDAEWKKFGVTNLRSDLYVECERTFYKPDAWASAEDKQKLEDVLAWLLLNSMRSEDLQHMQLCQQCLHNVWRRRAFARLLESEAPSHAGIAGNLVRTLDERPASSAGKDDGCADDACDKPDAHAQMEPLLLTRFVTEPLPGEDDDENEGEPEEEEAENQAELQRVCAQQFSEVRLLVDKGQAFTSYSQTRGEAYAEVTQTAYMLARGIQVDEEDGRRLELTSGKWWWECHLELMPDSIMSGELHVGVLEDRNRDNHAGFVFNFSSDKKELTSVVWKASSKGVAPIANKLAQGSCLCLLLDLSNAARSGALPSWAYRDGSAKKLHVGTPVVITNEAPDISGAYVADCASYVGKEGTVKAVKRFTDPRDANNEKDAIIVAIKDTPDEIFLFAGAIRPLDVSGAHVGGTLKLLVRDGDRGDEAEEVASITNIPPGRKLVPYVVWVNGSQSSAGPDKPIRLTMHWSAQSAMLAKDKEHHPIESKSSSERGRSALLRARQLQMSRQRSEQHTAIRMRPARWGIGVDMSDMLTSASSDIVSVRLDGGHRLQIAEGGDRQPVRLRTGRWWFECQLESLSNAHQTGALRIGYLSDKLDRSEWAGFEISLPSGSTRPCAWGKRHGVDRDEPTGLVFGAANRVALELTFPEGPSKERPAPSWTQRGASFDGPDTLVKGTRVIVNPDTDLVKQIMDREGAITDEKTGERVTGWTPDHKFYFSAPGTRTGEVVSLEPPRNDLLPTALARGSRVVGCIVKMDAPKISRHERKDKDAEQLKVQPEACRYLRFSPGCLLDEISATAAKDERATLSMVFRAGGHEVKMHRNAISLPSGVPLKPFVEWEPSVVSGAAAGIAPVPDGSTMTLGLVFGQGQFELNKQHRSKLLLPLVVDVVTRALQQTEADFAWRTLLAGQHIRDRFVRKLKAKVHKRRERVALPQPENGSTASERREHWSQVMDKMRFLWGTAAKAQGAQRLAQKAEVRSNVTGLLQQQNSSARLVYTEDGELKLGLEERQLLLEMNRTGLSAANASRRLEIARDNVGRMLQQFEVGRLASGGSFDEELHMEAPPEQLTPAAGSPDSGLPGSTAGGDANSFLTMEQLHRESKRTAFSIQLGSDMGDLSLPPPQVDRSTWLINCVRLFREELDLRLNESIPKPQPFLEKLITVVKKHAQFIDDQGTALEAVRSVLREVNRGDRSGGSDKRAGRRTNFDSEMVQEQQAEKEKAKEKESEQIYQIEHENAPRDDRPWKLQDLITGNAGRSTARGLLGNQFKPLREFKMVSKSKTLAFPSFVLATENHVYYQADVTHSRRLKNVEVLMQWIPQKAEVEVAEDEVEIAKGMHVVLLSLREAQTLRRAMQAKSEALSFLPTMCLFDVENHMLAQTEMCRSLVRAERDTAKRMHSQRELGMLMARFFDGDFFYEPAELTKLLRGLPVDHAWERRHFFEGNYRNKKNVIGVIKGRNRRSIQEFEGTPVEALFVHKTEHELVAARSLAHRTRRALERCKKADASWPMGEEPTLDQLYELVVSAGSTAVPIAQLAMRLSEILIKYPQPRAQQKTQSRGTKISWEDTQPKSSEATEAEVKSAEEGTLMEVSTADAQAPRENDEDDQEDEQEVNPELLLIRLTTMLGHVDRMRSGVIDFQLFARCFAIDRKEDKKGEAGSGEAEAEAVPSQIGHVGSGGVLGRLSTSEDDSQPPRVLTSTAQTDPEGVDPQGLISGVDTMHVWWAERERGRDEALSGKPQRESARSGKVDVAAHLMFTDPTEIGMLCAASKLQDAAITSGSDQRISCTTMGNGRVSFAPRGVLLGGRRIASAVSRRPARSYMDYVRFYFEVTLCEGGMNSAVGWADALWSANEHNGVGELSADGGLGKSWSFHFRRGVLCESECAETAEEEDNDFVCEPGDVVSCECDLSNVAKPLLIFRIIGSRGSDDNNMMRVLRQWNRRLQPQDPTCGLVPMVSLDGSTTLLVNLGDRPFAYAPNGEGVFSSHVRARSVLLPVKAWAHMRCEEQAMLEAGPSFATLQSLDGPSSMQLDKDGTAVTTAYAKAEKIVPSVVFRGICLTSGCWYYEVELLQEGNVRAATCAHLH